MPLLTKVRTLAVNFSEPIEVQELECFRGAIAEKVGLDRELYHNHNNNKSDSLGFHYRYPLIQYRLRGKSPQLLFINDAVEEARHFFTQSNWDLKLAGRAYTSEIAELKASQVTIGLSEEMQEYQVYNWLGLNSKNYEAYMNAENMHRKIELLEASLAGHVLSLATGLNHRFEERFSLELTDFINRKLVYYKKVPLISFNICFKANVQLPLGFSLGKGASLGFGRLRRAKEISSSAS